LLDKVGHRKIDFNICHGFNVFNPIILATASPLLILIPPLLPNNLTI
jgi:hypothetical protein